MGRRHLAEVAAEGHVLGLGDVLVPEEDDLPLEQRRRISATTSGSRRLGQVDAVDLSADVPDIGH